MSSVVFDAMLSSRKKLYNCGFFKKLFVDKNELRFEICMFNYSEYKRKFEASELSDKEISKMDITKVDEKFQSSKENYIKHIDELLGSNQRNITYCNFLTKLKKYVELQQIDDYNKSYFLFLLFETINNFMRKGNFFGYTDDWKEDMKQMAFFNCVKYLINFNEDRVTKENVASSAFSYVSQICNTSFITVLKEKKDSKTSSEIDALKNKQQEKHIKNTTLDFLIVRFNFDVFNEIWAQLEDIFGKNSFEVNLFVSGYLSEIDQKLLFDNYGKKVNILNANNTSDSLVSYFNYSFFDDGVFDAFGDKIEFPELEIVLDFAEQKSFLFRQDENGQFQLDVEKMMIESEYISKCKNIYFWNSIPNVHYEILFLKIKGLIPIYIVETPFKVNDIDGSKGEKKEYMDRMERYSKGEFLPELEYPYALVEYYKFIIRAYFHFLHLHSAFLRNFKKIDLGKFIKFYESRLDEPEEDVSAYVDYLVKKLGNPFKVENIEEVVESLGQKDFDKIINENIHLKSSIQSNRPILSYAEIEKIFEEYK